MARKYYQEDVSVLTYNAITGMVNDLGSGTLTVSAKEFSNDALMDAWSSTEVGTKSMTFEGELACDTTNWFTEVGGSGTLSFTSTLHTISGTFVCVSASLVLGDALRCNVTLKNKGTVTIS